MIKKLCVFALTFGLMTSVMLPLSAQAREFHPKIRKAINALQAARADLQAAAHDFGGHRVEAIAAIDKALEQLNLALQYDRK